MTDRADGPWFETDEIGALVSSAAVFAGGFEPDVVSQRLGWSLFDAGMTTDPAVEARKKSRATRDARWRRCRRERERGCSGVLQLSGHLVRHRKTLNDLRRQCAHFSPAGWCRWVGGLADIVRTGSSVIRQLALERSTFAHALEDGHIERLHEALAAVEGATDRLETRLSPDPIVAEG
ncbi:MAG: hypothetical protein AAFU49_10365 [Pseudomonadota bacterium]